MSIRERKMLAATFVVQVITQVILHRTYEPLWLPLFLGAVSTLVCVILYWLASWVAGHRLFK